jgi:hypothetical protein
MFSIHTKNLKLKLEVVPVESLFLHERTLPHMIKELILEFKNLGHLRNPIIIDENNIVLDGNHRVFVFKELKFKHIMVCRIDYFHESAHLRYWFRFLQNLKGMQAIKEAVERMSGRLEKVRDRKALGKALERNSLCCGVQQWNYYNVVHFSEKTVHDAVSAYDVLEKIQDHLSADFAKLKYIPCDCVHENEFCRELKKDEAVIWTPRITKEMVVEAAKREKLFAPKTTRHLIPARPLNLNIPGWWLKENISTEEINARFLELIKRKGCKRFGPGQVIEGRYYGEELFVFFDEG